MTIYQRVNGVWTVPTRPYVMRNGVWTAVTSVWAKNNGTWKQAYLYDVTPPNPPEIDLQIVEQWDTINGVKTLTTRYLKVGVRLPGSSHDPTARRVRVLTNFPDGTETAPTTKDGGQFTSGVDDTYPNEPWSEWRYNEPYDPYNYSSTHHDTSVVDYKQWPRNAGTGSTKLTSDFTYYFTGWAEDQAGNWSVATAASIHVPKAGVDAPNVVTKETRIQANSSGSWVTNAGFVSGDLIQQKSPRSVGLWFYGNQVTNSVGSQGTVTFKSAQIYVKRGVDGGQATANIYAFWTDYTSSAGLPSIGIQATTHDTALIGTLAMGQGSWFELPSSFYSHMNSDIKGMGLSWKDPNKADAGPEDYSDITGTALNLRCGELHLVWEEAL